LKKRGIDMGISFAICYTWKNIVPGAQTERRGGAGLVRGLLGGKDLTGRFFLSRGGNHHVRRPSLSVFIRAIRGKNWMRLRRGMLICAVCG
jgi:hypothetical protein